MHATTASSAAADGTTAAAAAAASDSRPASAAGAADAPPVGCDVLVVGGGPGGSTIAALLARQGRQVVLLEKAQHPRFHIGESLLPGNRRLFEALGVQDEVDRIGMPKYGIEFVAPDGPLRTVVNFGEGWDPALDRAWQVRRSELDELLFRHAARQGAQTLEGACVTGIDFDAEGATVHARLDDGAPRRWRARFVVDASGRDTLLARQLDSKRRNPKHASTALFAHFRQARRLEGRNEGHISICWFEHGWFWFIPLADGTTSVGAVCWPYYLKQRDKPLKDFFFETLAMCPELSDRLRGAELVDDTVHATGNFSYESTHAAGERYLMIGDAFGFIDPMFSSGVYLAMQGAFDGADYVATALDRPAALPAARRAIDRRFRDGPAAYSWFIYRVTNPTIRDMFLHPKNVFRIKQGLMSLLAADMRHGLGQRLALAMFRVVYYAISIGHWRRTLAGWRRHREAARDHGPLRGETVLRTE
ncbi:NAD(P)/FAD-dependent oxidoreductase [Piscinibacter sakaiensis]|uniref:FAD-binding protein n=1 Tax=Piscinibacter sakaiensis TaxID=1547922 RepID=A0A0K8P3L4_PISS1|nr:NAD(P)/FAD-dependent oxidoreductase [Piscinibacter sakaiensis]GAP37228.1 FAD-binding protein [Piscinibacter sakaiensis]